MDREETLESTFTTVRQDIPVEDKKILAAVCTPSTPYKRGVVFTHGAGGDMDTPQVQRVCEGLAGRGLLVLRFTCRGLNLKYRTTIYLGMLKYVKQTYPGLKQCYLGGRSMGSRAAVEVANQLAGTGLETFVGGVICVSYPLYPANSPDKIRDSPLYALEYPALFVSGDQDDMCSQSHLEKVLKRRSRWSVGGTVNRTENDRTEEKCSNKSDKNLEFFKEKTKKFKPEKVNDSIDEQEGTDKSNNFDSKQLQPIEQTPSLCRAWSVVWLEGAGHSLTTKSGGVDHTVRFVVNAVCNWMDQLCGSVLTEHTSEAKLTIKRKMKDQDTCLKGKLVKRKKAK